MNISSVSLIHMDGLSQLYDYRIPLAVLLLLLYGFIMLSDATVVYIVCSRRSLHRPMYVFVVAVLVNSAFGSSTIYPKLLWDLFQGKRVVLLSRYECFGQALILGFAGGSSFLLLSAMAFDRYLSICHPLRYAALMSPRAITVLLLMCWLVPLILTTGAVLIAKPCLYKATRLYCDLSTYVNLSCLEAKALGKVYSFLSITMLMLMPLAFILFSYGRVLYLCLRRSRSFASKALNTCLPHVIVLLNYSVCTAFDIMQRSTLKGEQSKPPVTASLILLVAPTVGNPIVYGLKVGEIYRSLKTLLRCGRSETNTRANGNASKVAPQ